MFTDYSTPRPHVDLGSNACSSPTRLERIPHHLMLSWIKVQPTVMSNTVVTSPFICSVDDARSPAIHIYPGEHPYGIYIKYEISPLPIYRMCVRCPDRTYVRGPPPFVVPRCLLGTLPPTPQLPASIYQRGSPSDPPLIPPGFGTPSDREHLPLPAGPSSHESVSDCGLASRRHCPQLRTLPHSRGASRAQPSLNPAQPRRLAYRGP